MIIVAGYGFLEGLTRLRKNERVQTMSFRRSLRLSKEVQYWELLSLLFNVLLCRVSKDSQIWKPSVNGELSTKAFYSILERNIPDRASPSLL